MIIFAIKIYKVRKINTDMAFCVKCGARKDEVDNYCVVCGSKHLIETEKNSKIKSDEYLQNNLSYDFFNSTNNVYDFISVILMFIGGALTLYFSFMMVVGLAADFFPLNILLILGIIQLASYLIAKIIYSIHNQGIFELKWNELTHLYKYLFSKEQNKFFKLYTQLFRIYLMTVVIIIGLLYLLFTWIVAGLG